MFMLEAWNAPKYVFRQIVEWYKEAREKNISFSGYPVSRDANMKEICQCVPNDLANKLLPQTATVDLIGFDDPVELVQFDMAEMILSLLSNPEVMQTNNLVVNSNNPFDNGLCYNDVDLPIGEPRTAKVYQDYLTANTPADDDFVFDLIFYVDRTHIDINSRFSVCPLIFTSSLFTEKARKHHSMWRQLGYVYDVHLKSSAENARSQRGHSVINNQHQIAVLLPLIILCMYW